MTILPKSLLKQGHRGGDVYTLQKLLSFYSGYALLLDGILGPQTTKLIKQFQNAKGLLPDGIVGPKTWSKLSEYDTNETFIYFIDAGHGDWHNGVNYTNPRSGKFAYHKNIAAHDGKGWYYEGHENRIIANRVYIEAQNLGVLALRIYDIHLDTPLTDRSNIVQSWTIAGYMSFVHSFHSNAGPKGNDDSIRGFSVFTTVGNNLSDKFAQWHFDHSRDEFGPDWVWRGDTSDKDSDYEANFTILKWTENIKLKCYAMLEEFGFHTSAPDVEFITSEETRKRRVNVAIRTLFRVYDYLNK